MSSSRSLWIVAASCLVISAGSASAADDVEGTRYRELAVSEAAFTSAVGAQRRGDLDSAERGYRRAIAIDSSFVEAIVNLARLHIERHELTRAAVWLDRAEQQRPEYPGIYAARGLLALGEGNPVAAIDALTRARSSSPRDVEVLTNLAAALLMQGTNREAIAILARAKQLAPHRPDTSFNLGLAYDKIGDTPRAMHHYERYLDLVGRSDPQRVLVRDRIGVLIGAGVPEPGPVRIHLQSSSPATSTRWIAKGGIEP